MKRRQPSTNRSPSGTFLKIRLQPYNLGSQKFTNELQSQSLFAVDASMSEAFEDARSEVDAGKNYFETF